VRRISSIALAAILALSLSLLAAMPQQAPTRAAGPGTVVVDELSAGFTPMGYGWVSDDRSGYAGHHYWARTARTSSLVGIWRATLAPGAYRVLAKIPGKHASTRKAVYKVKSADGWKTRVRNQAKKRGSWVGLGAHTFGTRAEVRLSDKTGDAGGQRRYLAFDAIRFIPLATPEPTPSPSPSPTPRPTPTPEPEPTASPTPTPEPTPSPTPEPTPEPTASPSPTPEPTSSPTPRPPRPKPSPGPKTVLEP
jgi:hypothetical protein